MAISKGRALSATVNSATSIIKSSIDGTATIATLEQSAQQYANAEALPSVGNTFGEMALVGSSPEILVEEQEVAEHNSEELSMALASLDDRSKDIIARRYLADEKETLHDLADEYNVSAERIRQIENGALKKLKAAMSNAA